MDKRELQAIAGLYDAACIMHGEEELATVFDKGEAGEKFAADLIRRWNAYERLVDALEDLDLRATQARLASSIGKPRLKDADFLRGELERICTAARQALTQARA